MNILLVEPAYKVKFPSTGLMRISTYHKSIGDKIEYVRGANMFVSSEPNRIYISSIFTYDFLFVKDAVQFYRMRFPKAKLWLGGLAATLIPEYFEKLGVDCLHKGLYMPAENFVPDYGLHPWPQKTTILLTHRGCVRRCLWCNTFKCDGSFQPKRVEDIKKQIIKGFEEISCWDNNTLAHPEFRQVIEMLEDVGVGSSKKIDFNQSLDIRLLDEKKARLLKRLKIYPLRFSFDDISYKEDFLRGVEICKQAGLNQETRVDVLYNFQDTPEDFYTRVYLILKAGWCPYTMQYKPITQPNKEWLSPYWTKEELNRWHFFCDSQLGRLGEVFNPRTFVYIYDKTGKPSRVSVIKALREQLFDVPDKSEQKEIWKKLKGREGQKDFDFGKEETFLSKNSMLHEKK